MKEVFEERAGCRLVGPGHTPDLQLPKVALVDRTDIYSRQAQNLTADLGSTRVESLSFLLRDRDGEYSQSFDAVFEAEEIEILESAPRAPRMNAHCERAIGSIRREALDHVLIMNENHARHVLTAYQRHYNTHQPHRARNQLPPAPTNNPPSRTNPKAADSYAPASSTAP